MVGAAAPRGKDSKQRSDSGDGDGDDGGGGDDDNDDDNSVGSGAINAAEDAMTVVKRKRAKKRKLPTLQITADNVKILSIQQLLLYALGVNPANPQNTGLKLDNRGGVSRVYLVIVDDFSRAAFLKHAAVFKCLSTFMVG